MVTVDVLVPTYNRSAMLRPLMGVHPRLLLRTIRSRARRPLGERMHESAL